MKSILFVLAILTVGSVRAADTTKTTANTNLTTTNPSSLEEIPAGQLADYRSAANASLADLKCTDYLYEGGTMDINSFMRSYIDASRSGLRTPIKSKGETYSPEPKIILTYPNGKNSDYQTTLTFASDYECPVPPI